jgi:glycosyltransferase involved in cell wall biosynthesis
LISSPTISRPAIGARRWVVSQIGARRHYAIPAILERAGLLERFYTDLCAEAPLVRALEFALPRSLRPRAVNRLLTRTVSDVPRKKIQCFPLFALGRILSRHDGDSTADSYRQWLEANRRFNLHVVRAGFGTGDTVYVFNGAGLEILERARQLGLQTVVDQTDAPVAVEESLLSRERAEWPAWENGTVNPDDWSLMADRERAEWALADTIVCGSSYVKEAIESSGGPVQRCKVVPYGFDGSAPTRRPISKVTGQPLRVLFLGTLCLRKGIQHVWQAARTLRGGPFQFRAVGPARLTEQAMQQVRGDVELVGTVPRSEVGRHYEWADVLVLPSISEGSANVCYEALAHGLPVVTTDNAGSVVRDGVEGSIVPIRDADAIARALTALSSDRDRLAAMSEAALSRAADFTLEKYAGRLLEALVPESCPERIH